MYQRYMALLSLIGCGLPLLAVMPANAQTNQNVSLNPLTGLSATVSESNGQSSTTPGPILVGDTATNQPLQGAWGYELRGPIPKGSTIVFATLEVSQDLSTGRKGSPYGDGFSPLRVERDEWAGGQRQLHKSSTYSDGSKIFFRDSVNSKAIVDVTTIVKHWWNRDSKIMFRARMSQLTDGDGIADNIRLNPGLLRVIYKPLASSARVLYVKAGPSSPYYADYWTMDAAGGNPIKVLDTVTDVHWQLDGQRFVFSRGPEVADVRGSQLWSANATGGDQKKLTAGTKGRDRHPVWSPDGGTVAFLRSSLYSEDRSGPDVWLIKADGTGERRLSPYVYAFAWPRNLRWSPSGRQIAFNYEYLNEFKIVDTVDASAKRFEPVTTQAYAWSPDGQSIAIIGSFQGKYGLFVLDYKSEAVRQLYHWVDNTIAPSWSPDGSEILFATLGEQNRELRISNIYTGNSRLVLTSPAQPYPVQTFNAPQFGPDGRIYFDWNRSNGSHIYSVKSNGTDIRQLTSDTNRGELVDVR